MNGSRRAFLLAAGATAGGLGVHPGTVAGTPARRIAVGEGMAALSAVTAAFEREHPDIGVEAVRTEGFEAFVRGETDVQQATRPMTTDERERAAENGVEFEKRDLPLGGVATIAPTDGWCRCLSESDREAFGENVETWGEIPKEAADIPPAELPGSGANVLVRGARSHQYAIGRGGVGYYEATPSAFGSLNAAPERATRVVRLGFGYVDRAALDREAVAAFVRFQNAAASHVEPLAPPEA
jgi:hypothetical protein